MTNVDIIFSQLLNCYIEIEYDVKLHATRFIRNKENLKEKKTCDASFELEEYFKNGKTDFSCDVDLTGLSEFTRKVLDETRKIRYGRTITYSDLARNIGTKNYRAVGRALGNNPILIIIPCHRVIAKNGIGGYSGGVDIKARLLEFEREAPF